MGGSRHHCFGPCAFRDAGACVVALAVKAFLAGLSEDGGTCRNRHAAPVNSCTSPPILGCTRVLSTRTFASRYPELFRQYLQYSFGVCSALRNLWHNTKCACKSVHFEMRSSSAIKQCVCNLACYMKTTKDLGTGQLADPATIRKLSSCLSRLRNRP